MSVVAIKEAVRERDGFKCVECGMTREQHQELYGRDLDVHRKIPGIKYALNEYCQTLCRQCHGPKLRGGMFRKKGDPVAPLEQMDKCMIHVQLDPALYAALHVQIKREGRTMRAVMKRAIGEYLEKFGLWKTRPAVNVYLDGWERFATPPLHADPD